MNRRALILAAMTVAVAAVLLAKHRRHESAPEPSVAASSRKAALYLFFDDRDHDEGCEQVYAAFEKAKLTLPADYEARRVDVGHEQALAEKFGVRMLPTILAADTDGRVTGRVEGEGDDIASRLRDLVARLPRHR